MKASDVMTDRVISVGPETSLVDATKLMLTHGISGLPVLDDEQRLVGIVTEGDLLRRAETGTERRRPRWLQFIIGPGRLAEEYVHVHGRKIADVMTREVATVEETTPLTEIVRLMEGRRIKRVPVVRGGQVVGIVSRANLVRALAALASEAAPPSPSDEGIRERLLAEIRTQPWAPRCSMTVIVRNGIVELFGVIFDERERQALCVAAENAPGVRGVRDHLVWIEPNSGFVLASPEDIAASDQLAPPRSETKAS